MYSDYSEEEKLYLLIEFIESLAIVALNLPDAIRARFIFSLSHICHQANRIRNSNWVDNLPRDRYINFKTMDKKCGYWKAYDNFKSQFSQIANDKFDSETLEFRDRFHHRVPVSIEIGLTAFVSRQKTEEGQVAYVFGGMQPVSLKKIVEILKDQYVKITSCLNAFQNLIHEQLNEISFI